MAKIMHLSEDRFESTIRENSGKIIIDFWASWCGPCRSLGKILDEVSTENEDITIYKINVDECSFLTEQYEVSSIPTLLFFNNSKMIDQTIGLMMKHDIVKKFH
ncbi:MAG: thioredoxin [Puniceicoccales bacterium]|jgi:thioredoxin 1|nr:thioredoxin [Puniceicoccales bacterium]